MLWWHKRFQVLGRFLKLCDLLIAFSESFQILCKMLSCSTFKGFQRMFRKVCVRLWGGVLRVVVVVNVFLKVCKDVLPLLWGLNQLFKFCFKCFLILCWKMVSWSCSSCSNAFHDDFQIICNCILSCSTSGLNYVWRFAKDLSKPFKGLLEKLD